MLKCSGCHSAFSATAKFCSECGRRRETDHTAPRNPAAPSTASTSSALPKNASGTEATPPDRERLSDASSASVILRRLRERLKDLPYAADPAAPEPDRQATECFIAAMKVAGIALWDWNIATGHLTFLNNFEGLYGPPMMQGPLNPEQAIKLVHADDHESVAAAGSRTIHSGADFHCEFRGRSPNEDGSPRWFVSHGHFRPEAEGRSSHIVGVTWEITDRVRTEHALRRSEAEARKLSMVANRTHNAVILTDATGRIEWVNDGFTRLTGYSLSEVVGRKPGSVLQGPESDRRVCAGMSAAIRRGEGFEVELINYHKSGRAYWVAVEARPIYDEAGRVTQFMAIESDISERKRAEQALQQLNEELERRVERRTEELQQLNADLRVQISERVQAEASLRASEQRLREIADTIHEAFWIATPEFDRVLYVSPGYERVWGRSCEGLYAAPRELLESIPADDAAYMLEQRRQGRLYDREYRLVRRDGTVRWVWNRGFPIRDEAGEISRYIDVALDITDRRKTKDALRMHSQVLLSMNEAVSFVDERGLILFTNPACEAMFGYEPGELVGLPVTICNAATPEENERIVHEVMTTVAERGVWAGEFRNLKKDGTIFWTNAHISKVADDGVVRFVSIQQDITERKKADEQLTSLKTQLAHASRLGTLGEMSAGLAHELNQPLTALCLYAAAARDAGASLNSPQLQEHLRYIDEQAHRAGEIIRRMRAFASRQASRREPADINQLLLEVAAILQGELRQSRVQTVWRLADDLPSISVDRIQIQQVVVNIIRNAVEAMLQLGGDVRRLTIGSKMEGSAIRVTISDTGAGLSPSAMSTLFAPFESTKSTGLGLGLAICRTLIEAHGGSIGVIPDKAPGATFSFVLPVASGAAPGPEQPA